MKKSIVLTLLVCLALSTVSSAGVLREIWWQSLGIDAAIARVNSGTPADQVDVLDNPTWADIADNYVAKMSGWLTVPATGEYTFYVSGDDYQRLYISQDDNPANAEMVAFVDGWTASQEWTKYASQKAAPMMLEEGQVIAIVGIMQEGGGGDGQDWGWTGPGVDAISVIPGDLFVSEYEVTSPVKAKVISPANGATGVITAVASWYMPDEDAEDVVYDLYFGTDPANLGLVAEGIIETSVAAGTAGIELDFATTYYWRVDVGGAEGFVWSFTTEPMTFAVGNIVATSNGTAQEGSGPEKTLDGKVSMEATDQWLAAPPEGEALWIQFAFPRVYKLYDATIFNSNTQFEALLGYGAKDVTIETSVDGAEWTVFADVELARAAETTIDLAGIGAKFVRLMINSNWGGMFPDSGLAEVAFTYVPAQARLIAPANGATGVSPAAVLDWYAGRGALSSDVTVNGEVATVEGSSFAADLIYGMPYTWQVDEFDGIDVWEGDVWNFTTAEFVSVAAATLVYDEEGNELEVDMDGADLTAYAPDTLRVAFRGNPVGFKEEDGVVTMGASGADIWDTADQFRYAYKTLNGDGSIIARVDSISNITNNWTKAGVMIRQSTAAGSQHSMTVITGNFWAAGAGNGASFQGRPTANAASVNNDAASAVAPPYYVKVERVGDIITGFISADGAEWLQLGGDREVVMEDPVLIGLAVTSHDTGNTVVAQLSEISTTGDVTGDWTAEAIGMAMPSNDAAGLYVAIEDAAGQVATVVNDNPAATQAVSTQNWNIPLAGLAGVDLANVAKITVGAGAPDAPAAGSGTVSVTISAGTPMSHNVLADVTSPADEIVGVPNDGDWPGAETPNLAFDNNVATKYLHFKGETEPTGVQITPAVGPTVVTGIALTTANDAVERDPVSFELYGSNDGIDGPYTLIASGDIVDFAGETAWPRFTKNVTPITFDNDVAYTNYQILFPAVRDPGSANSMQIAEIELIGVSSW
jgi:hypothetical protein